MPIPSQPVLDEEGEDTSVSLEQRIDSNIAQTRVGDQAGCETNVQERLSGGGQCSVSVTSVTSRKTCYRDING